MRVAVVIPFSHPCPDIEEAVSGFAKLCPGAPVDLSVYLVGRADTTENVELLRRVRLRLDQMGNPSLQLLVTPDRRVGKVAQISVALERLLEDKAQTPDYIGFYDIDSRPEVDTIVLLARLAEDVGPAVVQQPSLYWHSGNDPLVIADAVQQSIWTLDYEIPLWWSNLRGSRRLHYVIGHGLFVCPQVLARIPLGDECIVEDIAYGYRLFCGGLVPHVLPAFDFAATARNASGVLRQKGKWFCGSVYALWRHAGRRAGWLLFARRALTDIWWAVGYWLVFVGVVLGTAKTGYFAETAVILFVCYFLHFGIPAWLVMSRYRDRRRAVGVTEGRGHAVSLAIGGLMYYFSYNSAAWLGIWRALRLGSFRSAANSFGQTS
jgi:hypothetical protein